MIGSDACLVRTACTRVLTGETQELINGSEAEARERSRAARRRTTDLTYDYAKLAEATRQLRQVESEVDGKDWTRKTVQQLSRTLMDVRELLVGTQNKAAEIEIGSALHRHVVSAVQYAEALQGEPETETMERIRVSAVLSSCLKSVADQRQEMIQDDIGHGDIDAWVTKWQHRRAKQAADVLTAARALDERMRAEVESHMRSERMVDNVTEVDKEEFVARMNEVRQRTLSEHEGIVLDEERVDHVRQSLESLFHDRNLEAEKRLLDLRNRRGQCLDVIEQHKDHLVHILNEIKHEYVTFGGLAEAEEHILGVQKANLKLRASALSTVQDLRQGQMLLKDDLQAKTKAVELAIARGAQILDAITVRKHELENELDEKCRAMFVHHHQSSVCLYRYLFQTLADNEDRSNQLTDTLETHKYHFEQAVKVANFPEVSRLKELMKRSQSDIDAVNAEISEGAISMQARYRALWELERVLYQRFRYTETGLLPQDVDFDVLQEQANPAAFTSLAQHIPKPAALEPFSIMSVGRNVLRNPRFTEGKSGWTGNDTTELSLRRLVDDEFGYPSWHIPPYYSPAYYSRESIPFPLAISRLIKPLLFPGSLLSLPLPLLSRCWARALPGFPADGVLVQQSDVVVTHDSEYLLHIRSALRCMSRGASIALYVT
jgi:hypothetical protein